MVLQCSIRLRVAARLQQQCPEFLYQLVSKGQLVTLLSHWPKAYLSHSRWPVVGHISQRSSAPNFSNLIWLSAQVTIQVQEVELGGGTQRQGGFLATPGGHRVLGKQLSADNAESHRWRLASHHLTVKVPAVEMDSVFFPSFLYYLLGLIFIVYLVGFNYYWSITVCNDLFSCSEVLYVTDGQVTDLC